MTGIPRSPDNSLPRRLHRIVVAAQQRVTAAEIAAEEAAAYGVLTAGVEFVGAALKPDSADRDERSPD